MFREVSFKFEHPYSLYNCYSPNLFILEVDAEEGKLNAKPNDGRLTPERDEESNFCTSNVTPENMQVPKNPLNPSYEVIGVADRNQSENYIEDGEEDSQQPDDQEEMLIIVLKVVEGQQLNNVYLIGEQGARLGRHSASNDIVISESFVSRKHCEISNKEFEFFLKDLGSTTGSFLMIRDKVTLKEGMMFQMGLSEFKVSMLSKDMELNIFEGPSRNQTILVTPSGLRIGRDLANSFCVAEDTQMSNNHAKISFDPSNGTYILEDVGSTNKTWLRLSNEGEKSANHKLSVNDIIKIGSTVFLVQQIRKVSDTVNMPIINSNHRVIEAENNTKHEDLIMELKQQELEGQLNNSSLNLCNI
jgi:pSer/pThr/pTyr-binding forkhead associated (FHA) protein